MIIGLKCSDQLSNDSAVDVWTSSVLFGPPDIRSICYLYVQLNGQIKQNQMRWKAAHDKWVTQDNTIKNTIAQVRSYLYYFDITSVKIGIYYFSTFSVGRKVKKLLTNFGEFFF